jgi:hypothetical protein
MDDDLWEIENLLTSIDFGSEDWQKEWLYQVPPVIKCQHEWRRDMFFSARVYETCTKCGAKKEDL